MPCNAVLSTGSWQLGGHSVVVCKLILFWPVYYSCTGLAHSKLLSSIWYTLYKLIISGWNVQREEVCKGSLTSLVPKNDKRVGYVY